MEGASPQPMRRNKKIHRGPYYQDQFGSSIIRERKDVFEQIEYDSRTGNQILTANSLGFEFLQVAEI